MDQSNAKIIPFDPEARFITVATITNDTVSEKLNDALTPSYQAEFDPQEADSVGAFFEDALSEDDALASTHDTAHFAPQLPPPKF